jgi:hypothetical protein
MNGQRVLLLDLSRDGEYTLTPHPAIRFRVQNGAAAFTASDCPDKICVNTGFIKKPREMAVCMPNRVSLYITGPDNENNVDTIAR